MSSNGTWYLFYSGEPDATGNNHSIGVATAAAVTGPYTRFSGNPVISYSGTPTFDEYRACEPYVYYSAILGQWVMLYMGDAGSGSTQIEQVGFATAATPLGPWTKSTHNPLIPFSPAPAWDSGTVADPFAVELNGTAYIGYTGATGTDGSSSNWTIGFASTTNYQTITKIGQVYGRGATGEWDAQTSFRGAVSRFGNTWYLPYTGNGGSGWNWGVATMSAVSTAKGFDPFQVFDYYDNFSGSTLDTNIWGHPTGTNEGGSQTVANNILTLNSGTGTFRTLVGRREFGTGYLIEVTSRHDNADGTGNHAGEVGLAPDSRNQALRIFDYNTNAWQKSSENNSSGTTTNMAQLIDTNWHTDRIAFVSSTSALFQVDDNPWEQLTTTIPTVSLKPWLFVYSVAPYATTMDVSSVIVRRYANPEPTITVGGESTDQTAGGSSLTTSAPATTTTLQPPGCSAGSPGSAPNLYAIHPTATSATLYFAPALDPVSSYVIRYGYSAQDPRFGVQFAQGPSTGAIAYTIHALSPGTSYWFQVRAGNGCATGSWSTARSATTLTTAAVAPLTVPLTPHHLTSMSQPPPSATLVTPLPGITPLGGYAVAIRVLGPRGTPVTGAAVTLHSRPQTARTDRRGIAHFSHVTGGAHELTVAYQGQAATQPLWITGNNRRPLTLTVQQRLTNPLTTPPVFVLAGLLLSSLFVSVWLLTRRARVHRADPSS